MVPKAAVSFKKKNQLRLIRDTSPPTKGFKFLALSKVVREDIQDPVRFSTGKKVLDFPRGESEVPTETHANKTHSANAAKQMCSFSE